MNHQCSLLIITAITFILPACFESNAPPLTKTNNAVQTDTTPKAAYERSIGEGAGVFETKCIGCHGNNEFAGIAGAADLSASRLDSASIAWVLFNGRNAMPSFDGRLTDEELRLVINYVYALRK